MASPGPVVHRRRVAEELRRLRTEADRTLEEVADALLISTSKLSRLENAQGRPQPRDVRDLIRFYGIEGTKVAERLQQWTKAAQERGWWSDKNISTELSTHLAYEAEAAVARVYTIPMFPVLLQTPEYSRAYYREGEPSLSGKEIERYVELRKQRQKSLDKRPGQEALRLVAVVHESALYQVVGSHEVMREQFRHLIERSTAHNVELRVLPFTAPPLPTIGCTYGYFEFSEPLDHDVVDVETHAGIQHLDSADEVARYREHHDRLCEHALTTDQTRARLREVLAERYT
ncbi:helix-turn-helix domain-containing protein [Prauserella muralis]|uniref:Transcriptional regulator n=1 Tax=Prauserella muralis TaxID=588067 RepID=A0A2V4B939_9PSEU|nr:helix-turn-helix transcriptional regulator [Prauserella muralis]PXY31935.1 transcriptional regulator [Prauserella muralis]TWE13640.1 helix-turn-helix protein [Prauserella muralis]